MEFQPPHQPTTNTTTTTNNNNANDTNDNNKPYKCEIDITFPTKQHAQQCMDVLSVDDEIGDRVCKSFSVIDVVVVDDVVVAGENAAAGRGDGGDGGGETVEDVTTTVMSDEGLASVVAGADSVVVGDKQGEKDCEIKTNETGKEEGSTKSGTIDDDDDEMDDPRGVLRVNIQATEAKMLRVSISSFYDMLTVFLKCQQEFGGY